MATEAELLVSIQVISASLRGADGVKRESTAAEDTQMAALKEELYALRNPPPPPPPPLTANQLRFRELTQKNRDGDLTLSELNELIRLGGTGF